MPQTIPIPSLSVILLLPEDYESRRRAVSFLARQTVREKIELVLVLHMRVDIESDEVQLRSFGSYQLVRLADFNDPGQAMSAGIHAARAPIVAYVEEHAFPEPDWAEALLRAHEGPYAAVGCAMGNANPGTLCSWAHLFDGFGPLVTPVSSGVATYLGAHNSSYKRDVLLAYGDALPNLLDNGTVLHIDLRRRGHQLFLAGDAVINHTNISQVWAYWRQEFVGMRAFAGARAASQRWSPFKCGIYCLASPLIPMVRLVRILKEMRRAGRATQLLPQVLALLIPGLVFGAAGEVIGYLFGDSTSNVRIRAEAELNRARFQSSKDASP
jgi:hypothetical protein